MSSYQRYMPQQNHAVGTRGRQQYQQPPPPPPEPTIRDMIQDTAQMTQELVTKLTNVETKLDKVMQYLQNKQNQTLVNTNPPNNNIGNIFE